LDLSEPEASAPSPSARSTPIAEPCSGSTGQACPVMTTSEPSTSQMDLPMSSAGASPARTSARPARAPELPASGRAYGSRCAELLARYDPDSSSWRTSQLCLDGALTVFSETWPRSGMTRNGTAYRLPPLAPLTAATASGLWPTPNVPNGGRTIQHAEFKGNTAYHNGKKVQVGLEAAVRMWPTPVARDSRTIKGAQHPKGWTGAKGLCETVGEVEGTATGSLNPTWVEWLMGFPSGWTALEPSETPLSRKSPS
jgi:hypothetical protein